MITASVKGGIFTYQCRQGINKITIRGPKNAINLAIPYFYQKIKKAAQ